MSRIRSAVATLASALLKPFGLRALSADREWYQGVSSPPVSSGVDVNEQDALGEVTIFACVRVISWTVASMPRYVYRRLDPRGKDRERTHPVARVIRRPNDWMNPFAFWSAIVAQAAWRGEGFAQIVRDGAQRPIELWPLPYNTRPVEGPGGRLQYEVPQGATSRRLDAANVIHIRCLTADGVTAFRPIQLAAEAVGLALAAERFAARFFGNGSNLAGVLTHPGNLSEQAKKGLKKSWRELYAGVDNSHDVAVLEEGLKYETIGTEPDKGQLIETRKEQALAMCRLAGVPPPMVGILEGSSYATAEQQNLAFATHTIRPWLESIEDELDFKLLNESEQDSLFVEHNMDALLRGDFATRMTGWGTAIQNGIYCVDEVRDKENENPLPDSRGTDYFHQVNLVAVPAGGLADAQEKERAAKMAAATMPPAPGDPSIAPDPTSADPSTQDPPAPDQPL